MTPAVERLLRHVDLPADIGDLEPLDQLNVRLPELVYELPRRVVRPDDLLLWSVAEDTQSSIGSGVKGADQSAESGECRTRADVQLSAP